ncbi:MAG TPA: hypothetical protein VIM62_06820 [Acidobacteriaceae bacterium]
MHLLSASQVAMLRFHGLRAGGRGGFEIVLLLVGIAFAGLLVWAIERSGRPRIYR